MVPRGLPPCLPKGCPSASSPGRLEGGVLALGEEAIQVPLSQWMGSVLSPLSLCVCEGRRKEGREVGCKGGRERLFASWEPISLTITPGGPHATWGVLASTGVTREGGGGLRDWQRHLRMSESKVQRG